MKTRPCRCCDGSGKEVDPVALGFAMRQKRRSARISLREVARRMGFSAAYLSDLEQGKRGWNSELISRYGKAIHD